jgi:CCR4-NOT transcription complex subunit 7/8
MAKRGGERVLVQRGIKDVWAGNLEEEMANMQDVAEDYQHIAMDALLPGFIAQPTGPFNNYAGYNYQTLRCNVDLTRAIQIGLTLSDGDGNKPEGTSTWRFNFLFDADRDMISPDLTDKLRNKCGLDLEAHHSQGIDVGTFGELLMSSGLVLNEDIKWISFCGDLSSKMADLGLGLPWVAFAGLYTFGHLLHLLTSQSLPDALEGFYESLDLFFPNRCDIAKHLHQLPQLSGRDPADPQRRPFFCNAIHVLDAFFRLPDSVRSKAFDRDGECEEEARRT